MIILFILLILFSAPFLGLAYVHFNEHAKFGITEDLVYGILCLFITCGLWVFSFLAIFSGFLA